MATRVTGPTRRRTPSAPGRAPRAASHTIARVTPAASAMKATVETTRAATARRVEPPPSAAYASATAARRTSAAAPIAPAAVATTRA